MSKINQKFVKAIIIVATLNWVIMQIESAQAATFTVSNLYDSGVGSLRDTISTANSDDVIDFLLGSNPGTITLTSGALAIAKNLTINGPGANLLTITTNNQFPLFDISSANVTLSGLTLAGNINAYNSSNLTLINSTVRGDNVKIDTGTGSLTFINSTISSNSTDINVSEQTIINNTNTTIPNSTTNAGNISISAGNLVLNNVTIPVNATNSNSGQISGGSNNGGNITITPGTLILKSVPEPSAIAGSILGVSLALLAKRKQ